MSMDELSRIDTRVAQASGMIAAQTGCSTDDALRLIFARAESSGESDRTIAVAVIEGRICFTD